MKLDYPAGATPLSPEELAELIPGHVTLQGQLNELEEASILRATEWLYARRRGDPLDERFVHRVHQRMFDGVWKWAGKVRQSDKNLGAAWYDVPARLRTLLEGSGALAALCYRVSCMPLDARRVPPPTDASGTM